MRNVRGALYCILWFSSILSGYFILYCPILPFLLISNKLYRWATDIIFTFWQTYPTALTKFLLKCEVEVSGDFIDSDEMSILIMNHRTRTDWNFLWSALHYSTKGKNAFLYSTKFLLKNSVKNIPGPGWVMQLTSSLYIKRKWDEDKQIFEKFCRYISDTSYKCAILIFPEGTDLTATTKKKSDDFAEKNNLKKYVNVLHPRSTGFSFFANELLKRKCLDSVYDLTIAYHGVVPQTEKSLFEGSFPELIRIHIEKFPLKVLPTDEDGFKNFLAKRWEVKENKLSENTKFEKVHSSERDSNLILHISAIFWSLLPLFTTYLFIVSGSFRLICMYHTFALVVINCCMDNFQNFEIYFFNLKRKLFGSKFIF